MAAEEAPRSGVEGRSTAHEEAHVERVRGCPPPSVIHSWRFLIQLCSVQEEEEELAAAPGDLAAVLAMPSATVITPTPSEDPEAEAGLGRSPFTRNCSSG